MFRKILCPFDLTNWTRPQLAYARNFARFQCADIHKVRMHQHMTVQPRGLSTEVSYQHLGTSANESSFRIPADLISDPIRSAHELHRIAIEKHFDLIVMPANLKSSLNKTECETIFPEVLSSSAIPILALPSKTKFKLPKRILCVIDINQNPSKISHIMPELAAEARAKYFIMNTFEPDEETLELNEYIMSKAEQILSYIMQEVSYALGADEITVRIGHVPNEILTEIEQKKIDMLLIGFSYFRSESLQTTLDIIGRLSIPALCIPETNGSLYAIH